MAGYLTTTELDSALIAFENTYPSICSRIELPEKTHESRTCWALRIGSNFPIKSSTVLFTAGVHAREWGGPDSCINFIADLLEAYAANQGLQFGSYMVSAAKVQSLVDELTIIVFPCSNPDGRAFDMQGTPQTPEVDSSIWRKNRRPATPPSSCLGVDCNRNQDFLWDSDKYLADSAAQVASSPDPCSYTYRGPSASSEPETRNIAWLLDSFPVDWYLDIHAFTGVMLFPWGHAPNQSYDTTKNFANPVWDGQRGTQGALYGEYMAPDDLAELETAANAVADAMNQSKANARGHYLVAQSFFLNVGGSSPAYYPTTGTNDDFAFGRHLVNSLKRKVRGFTLEFGFEHLGDLARSFHPEWSEMEKNILDVTAGMLEFCRLAQIRSKPTISVPEIVGQILGGVASDGGGILILPSGKIIRIPPRQPVLIQILEGIAAYTAAVELKGDTGSQLRTAALNAVQQIIAEELSH